MVHRCEVRIYEGSVSKISNCLKTRSPQCLRLVSQRLGLGTQCRQFEYYSAIGFLKFVAKKVVKIPSVDLEFSGGVSIGVSRP